MEQPRSYGRRPSYVQGEVREKHKRGLWQTMLVRTILIGLLALVASCGESPSHVPSEYADVVQLAAGSVHTCALVSDGSVRCWGRGERGQTGHGSTEDVGDDLQDDMQRAVSLGGRATQISAGFEHTCALMESGEVLCWGHNAFGQLGYGHTETIGDDELPIAAGPVALGEKAVFVAAGGLHTCVLVERGAIRCWGDNTNGQLGYGNTEDLGDDETPIDAPDVDVGEGEVVQLTTGFVHSCARFASGALRCWGRGERPLETAVGGHGQLGYGNTEDIGDDEVPAEVGDVPVGEPVAYVSAGIAHTCAVTVSGNVRCWGRGEGRQGQGQLGYQEKENIGDDETPADAGDVETIGNAVVAVAGDTHSCLIDESGALQCWGFGGFGQLGYGNMHNIGDDEAPAVAGTVPVGETVIQVVAGSYHSCVLTASHRVYCFGLGNSGQLGYCDERSLGDDETPEVVGAVPL